MFLAVLIAILSYDLIAYSLGGNSATISNVCLQTMNDYRWFGFTLVFSVGMLFGHLGIPQHVYVYPVQVSTPSK